ncbi:MAG: ATP-binding protein [Candidatus Sumerlaeia bacterium]|nr:ATP-binding protein [Candidatus Sumerlaeia bacterium]
MIIQFTLENFKSFRHAATFSMQPVERLREHPENIAQVGKHKLLRTAAIYGANASGKSNLLKGMMGMIGFILKSFPNQNNETFVEPFLLSKETTSKPTLCELVFFVEDVTYRYGFTATKDRIHTEWLYRTKLKEKVLFTRDENSIQCSDEFHEGKPFVKTIENNSLFLSLLIHLKGEHSRKIADYLNAIGRSNGKLYVNNDGIYFTEDKNLFQKTKQMLSKFDVGIQDIQFVKDENKSIDLRFVHLQSGNAKESNVLFKIDQVSDGTLQLFQIIPSLQIAMECGSPLIFDELDLSLHPFITNAIVNLFNSAESNPKNAQLIFSAHDTGPLSHANLRRDQIWFTEKNLRQESVLYSLVEFKDGKVRSDGNYEKQYLEGRYGAIPNLSMLDELEEEISKANPVS